MSTVLTEGSTLKCPKKGTVALRAGQSKLTVGGRKVLVEGDLTGASITSCLTPTSPPAGTKQCTSVTSVFPGGVATKLKVGGKGVLLEEIQGLTEGIDGGPQKWSVEDAGQTKLKTV